MSNTERPTSPHLTIYRWPITMTLSILHRATGVAMSIGLIVLTAWLAAAAAGPEIYDQVAALLSTLVGRIMLIGWSFSFFFHLANGLRHLVWDTGRGFEKRQTNASAWLAIIAALVLTAVYWIVLL
jgi:succinate dehydrogenase / fumarate reductase cytochrome b subunit